MRYKIKINWCEDSNIYEISKVVVSQEDTYENIRVLNSMLKSGEILSYEVSMEGH